MCSICWIAGKSNLFSIAMEHTHTHCFRFVGFIDGTQKICSFCCYIHRWKPTPPNICFRFSIFVDGKRKRFRRLNVHGWRRPGNKNWSMSQGEKIYTLTICLFTDIQYFLFPIFVRIDIPYFWQDLLKIFCRIFMFYFLVYLKINNPKNWPKIVKKG